MVYIYMVYIYGIYGIYVYMVYIYGIYIYMVYIYGIYIWYIYMVYMVYMYIWYIYIWYIYIWYIYIVYIKISIHQNVKPGRTAGTRWHPLARPGLSTDLHGSFWSPLSLLGMPHRSDIDRLSRCQKNLSSWPNIGKPHNKNKKMVPWGIYLIYL